MAAMMNGASLDHGRGRRADDSTNCSGSALNDGRGEDDRAVDSANTGTNASADGTTDNVTDGASNGATLIRTLLGAADNALSMGGERHCKRRHQRHGGRGKSG